MPRPHGTIRQSQIITIFGPGAMVDLPHHSVIVGGLDDWNFGNDRRAIFEDRLVAKLESLLEISGLKLFAPPVETSDPHAPATGVTVWQFPEWHVAQHSEMRGKVRARPLVHRQGLVADRYEDREGRKHPVVPVRFVQACPNGHISDIDWPGFVHQYQKPPCLRPLWVEEWGTSGDLADIVMACECGKSRSMAQATRRGADSLGFCNGQRPWLGPAAWERCGGGDSAALPSRLLLRSASDAYFPQVLRVISIPDQDAALRMAVDKVWDDFLLYVESPEDLTKERKKAKVFAALEGQGDAKVLAEIQRRRGDAPPVQKSIKQAECETLLDSKDELGADAPDGVDFYAKRLALPSDPIASALDRIVLVHRLREVMALAGFTRFEPVMPDIDGELALEVKRAALARETTWLPAVENRGEGFFLSFRRDVLQAWLARKPVKQRGEQLKAGFEIWKDRHQAGASLQFPGLPYVFLHSLSHLLITAVSLECGYSASSIRERIYAGEAGWGILLYTGTPDAEGTLGGLVQVGRRIEQHLRAALEMGGLCSNDPVCAQHTPDNKQEERFLNGAACHGCLLIAEPSCERRNEFLDRALVVATVDALGAEFFGTSA